MTEHNNPVGPTTNKDTLRAELANALHEDWCGCDSWDGVNCEGYYEGAFPESADAALAVVVPVLERQAAEVARLQDAAANTLANQTALKGMTVGEGALVLELGPPRELVIAWVDAARKMLGDAENYSETRIDFPAEAVEMEIEAAGEFERYAFTVQRVGKVTPHEARRAAEGERDGLRAEVARLTRERDEAQQSVEAAHRELADYQQQYADLWRDANTERIQFDRVLTHLVPAARQVNGTISGLVLREQAGDLVKKLITDLETRPAMSADAADLAWSACMDDDKFTGLASDQILEVIRRTLKAIAPVPVSGSDTAEVPGE